MAVEEIGFRKTRIALAAPANAEHGIETWNRLLGGRNTRHLYHLIEQIFDFDPVASFE
jgi:hypothetical protein